MGLDISPCCWHSIFYQIKVGLEYSSLISKMCQSVIFFHLVNCFHFLWNHSYCFQFLPTDSLTQHIYKVKQIFWFFIFFIPYFQHFWFGQFNYYEGNGGTCIFAYKSGVKNENGGLGSDLRCVVIALNHQYFSVSISEHRSVQSVCNQIYGDNVARNQQQMRICVLNWEHKLTKCAQSMCFFG